MSSYTSFAVVGAGYIGLPIAQALAERKASVIVLTRSPTKTELPEGVKVAVVDYNNIAAVQQVLSDNNVQVVISTVNTGGLSAQNTIAEAAKLANVKLFAPSEFGVPTEGGPSGILAVKDKSASERFRSLPLKKVSDVL